MVDFNNETTIGTPAVDVVRILVLQARANLFEAWEDYRKREDQGVIVSVSIVYSRLYTLFEELQASLKRNRPKDYPELLNKIDSKNVVKMIDATRYLNEYLDEIRLTRLDTKKVYDRSSFEEENQNAGL